MRKPSVRIHPWAAFIATFLICLCGPFQSNPRGEIVDRIVAVVNEDIVTLSELIETISLRSSELENSDEKQAKREMLDELIDRLLIRQELNRANVGVTEQEVNMAIEDVLSQNRMSEQSLRMALMEQGNSYKRYRDELRDQLGKMKIVNQQIRSKVDISEADLKNFYRQQVGELESKMSCHIRHILIRVPEETTPQEMQNLRGKAESLLQEIQNGADFAETARSHSHCPSAQTGGDLGFLKEGETFPELEESMISLEPDQVSEVIQTPLGFHIVQLLEKKVSSTRSFEEAREGIYQLLFQKEVERLYSVFLSQLRSKAYIELQL